MNAKRNFDIILALTGLSKREIAHRLGMTYSTLRRRILGEAPWRACELVGLEHELGVPRDVLLGDDPKLVIESVSLRDHRSACAPEQLELPEHDHVER